MNTHSLRGAAMAATALATLLGGANVARPAAADKLIGINVCSTPM